MKKVLLSALFFCFVTSAMAQEPVKKTPSGKAMEQVKRKKEKRQVAEVKKADKVNAERKLVLIPKERCGTR